jgi:hypothetical protein
VQPAVCLTVKCPIVNTHSSQGENVMATSKGEKVQREEVFAFFNVKPSRTISGEGEIEVSFMVRETTNGHDQFYNVSDTISEYVFAPFGGLYLHDLKVRGYIETKDGAKTISAYYAKPQYRDVYRVELETAEAMAHTLRAITNKVNKFSEEWGAAQTFAQGCLYIMKAIGVKRIVRLNTPHAREVTDEEYCYSPVADVASVIYDLLNPPIVISSTAPAVIES